MDKLIPEALPLPEAPPAVRSVHLYQLLCAVTVDRSSPPNALPLTVCLRQETGTTRIEPREDSFVVYAPEKHGVRATLAAEIEPRARLLS